LFAESYGHFNTMREEPSAKLTGFYLDYRADVDNKAKKMSAFAISPSYRTELTGSLSLQHCEMTIGKTDVFLAVVVRVCSNLAFLGSGG